MSKYVKNGNVGISKWRSKGIFNEIITPPVNALAPTEGTIKRNMHLSFNRSCLKTTEKYLFYP